MEVFQEILRIQVLGGSKQIVDISGDEINKRIHPILIMESQFLLICLHFSQDLFLFSIIKPINKVKSLMPSLYNDFSHVFPFVPDIFDDSILLHNIYTILDF